MALRDKIRANAQQVLQPGEVIQAVIPAQTVSPYFVLITYWIIILSNAYRVIVVTDRRIMVCRSGRLRISPVGQVEFQVPRGTLIGPGTGLWYKSESLGQPLYISRRFFNDVAAADALAAADPGAVTGP